MDFSDVTDIIIPEGSVTKIEETLTNRVLWQKGLAVPQAHWEIIELPAQDANGWLYAPLLTALDTDDGVEIFTTKCGHFKYSADGSLELISRFAEHISTATTTHCADIDPITKTWVAFSGGYYSSNAFDGLKNLSTTHYRCRWSPVLKCFCAMAPTSSRVINLNGEIQGESQQAPFYNSGSTFDKESLLWSDTLNKFVVSNITVATSPSGPRSAYEDVFADDTCTTICFSSDGLKWETKPVNLVGNFPNFPVGYHIRKTIYNMCWMPTMEKFVSLSRVFAYDSNGAQLDAETYMVTSSDCNSWERIEVPQGIQRLSVSHTKPSYSPEKKVLTLIDDKTSYITRDLQNWTEVPYIEGMMQDTPMSVRWSKSLNAFIRIGQNSGARFYKLVIDN